MNIKCPKQQPTAQLPIYPAHSQAGDLQGTAPTHHSRCHCGTGGAFRATPKINPNAHVARRVTSTQKQHSNPATSCEHAYYAIHAKSYSAPAPAILYPDKYCCVTHAPCGCQLLHLQLTVGQRFPTPSVRCHQGLPTPLLNMNPTNNTAARLITCRKGSGVGAWACFRPSWTRGIAREFLGSHQC